MAPAADAWGVTIAIMHDGPTAGTRSLHEGVLAAAALTVHRGRVYWLDERARLLVSVSIEGGDPRAEAGWWPAAIDGRALERTRTVGIDGDGERIFWSVSEAGKHEGRWVYVDRVMSVRWDGSEGRVE